MTTTTKNEYFGYSLFNDIEDVDLQARNRAASLKNIMEDHIGEDGKPTPKAGMLTFGYFNLVPASQRKTVYDHLQAFFQSKKGL